jgi:hypothetical protein
VVEQADAPDSKSGGPRGRAGSTPAFGTILSRTFPRYDLFPTL